MLFWIDHESPYRNMMYSVVMLDLFSNGNIVLFAVALMYT